MYLPSHSGWTRSTQEAEDIAEDSNNGRIASGGYHVQTLFVSSHQLDSWRSHWQHRHQCPWNPVLLLGFQTAQCTFLSPFIWAQKHPQLLDNWGSQVILEEMPGVGTQFPKITARFLFSLVCYQHLVAKPQIQCKAPRTTDWQLKKLWHRGLGPQVLVHTATLTAHWHARYSSAQWTSWPCGRVCLHPVHIEEMFFWIVHSYVLYKDKYL